MSRYIDADAFGVFGYSKTEGASEEYNDGFGDGVQYVLECIDNVPTEDVKPVVRGEWICVCSNCGHKEPFKAKFLYSYCPNCGARMGEEGQERMVEE